MALAPMRHDGRNELLQARGNAWHLYAFVGVFSFAVNLLMLTGPLFMMQVYDRVLASRSVETLTALFLLVVFLFLLMGLLDLARNRVMARVAARFPRCEVIAVDIDPFLIALGRAAHPGIGFVRADMATTDWTQHLRSTPVSAVVSSTALHYPTPSALADIYRTCAEVLSSGGVMVNADHLHPSAYLREVARLVGARSAHRRDTPPAAEDWEHWWAAANRVPEFADLLRDRMRLVPPHPGDNDLMVDDHRRLMCDNGFAVADTVWQCGFSTVLVGRKAP